MTAQQVWLITGASSGFGAALAKEVLNSGHRVIATARSPARAAAAHPEIEQLGGQWIDLDVTLSSTAEKITNVIREVGHVDVVVNNAGYSILGSFEDLRHEVSV
ncbi:hypothetical protein FE257_012173 [Aspergillus nanangensis]|uniref:Uncharacterized protein n=1 Tax=Aspergillus nanangensis TaxID=2582783 RepID=A0AAD4CGD0_ASPNN|nr:hypothetical protein FE257_012173 [Aspergillus nanangensis]